LVTLHLDDTAHFSVDALSRRSKDAWHEFGSWNAWHKDDVDQLGKELQIVRSIDLQRRPLRQILFVWMARIGCLAIE
jgi:hypothetical protein